MFLKYLITGTGRSGTVYVARMLTKLGLTCGHECVFDHNGYEHVKRTLKNNQIIQMSNTSIYNLEGDKNIKGWPPQKEAIVADSSYMAAPFLNEEEITGVEKYHVVRDLTLVVHSFVHHIGYFKKDHATNQHEAFIYEHLPELKGNMPQYDRAALYVARWNGMISKTLPNFYRLEDQMPLLVSTLGLHGEIYENYRANTYQKDTGSRFYVEKIQSKTIKEEFVSSLQHYGYGGSHICRGLMV